LRFIECCNANIRPQHAGRFHEGRLSARVTTEFAEILSPEALEFLAKLHTGVSSPAPGAAGAARGGGKRKFDRGVLPDFLAETKKIRDASGRSRRNRRTCSTGASRSPVRPIARW